MIAALVGLLYADGLLERAGFVPGALVAALFVVLGVPAARELTNLLRAKGATTAAPVLALGCVVGGLGMYALPWAGRAPTALALYATGIALVLVVAMLWHCRSRQIDGALSAAGAAMLGLVYLGTLPGFFLALRHEQTVWALAGVILVTKSCDIGAYFTGRAVGRHKLIPWLSPGKTWEGLVGGLVFAGLVAMGLAWLSNEAGLAGHWVQASIDGGPLEWVFKHTRLSAWLALPAGMALGLVGQGGDLLASLLKRDAGVKDSGASLPGFGGVLDVLDSPILAAPLAYWLLV